MTDYGASAFAYLLSQNLPSLRGISLFCNQIGDAGALELANALAQNTRLEVLVLSNNEIDNDGVEALIAGIWKTSFLKQVLITGNFVSDCQEIIDNVLRETHAATLSEAVPISDYSCDTGGASEEESMMKPCVAPVDGNGSSSDDENG